MPRSQPRPSVADFRRHLRAKAALVAPSDVTALVAKARAIRARLRHDRPSHPRLAQRCEVALRLLQDHARGSCPQIPYHTIGLLAAAVYYYIDPFDVIPDSLPRSGTADDALMLDLAWTLGKGGIDRYLEWSGLSLDDVPAVGASTSARRRPHRR